MTLGEFRKLTEDLPDDTEFVDDQDIAADVCVDIKYEPYLSDSTGELRQTNHRLQLIYL